ncbi:hypothetical protein BANRA_00960 [Klebsiella pneumoniae]|nr:hypothetical protein BANRA_00960 [Klebsiella pneumoniae]
MLKAIVGIFKYMDILSDILYIADNHSPSNINYV